MLTEFAFIGTARCSNARIDNIRTAELVIFLIAVGLIVLVTWAGIQAKASKKKLIAIPLIIYILGTLSLSIVHYLALCHDESGGTIVTYILGFPILFLKAIF